MSAQASINKRKWWMYHKLNPQVWHYFELYTFQAIESGRKHYSAWTIIGRIRWDHEITTKSGDFKISNNHIAYYARYFHHRFPMHDGFFNTKEMKEDSL